MLLSDFDYDLPPDLIARIPAEPRDAARLMVLRRHTGEFIDSVFRRLPEYLQPSDVLVLNDTRVIRARTHGRLVRVSGSSREIEVFFAEPVRTRENTWNVLCKPGRRIRPGDRVLFRGGEFTGTFAESLGDDLHILELESVDSVLELCGQIPLPPYIARDVAAADESSYQTIYGVHPGAVAAPTAGLHFTEDVLAAIRALGIEIVRITLHVGIGTFLPVRTERAEDHLLRPERFEVSEETAAKLRRAVSMKRRVVAVGTTSTRTLEYLMREYGEIRAGSGYTDLYILPGFEFRIVDALLTNFHLPRSTLLMLVSAFAGHDRILSAYQHAIAQKYRFYSYGDCMLVEKQT